MRLTPDRERKIADAERLSGEGWTRVEIANHLGVTPSCVTKWLNPEGAKQWQKRDNAKPHRLAEKEEWLREHGKEPCLGGCGRLVWRKGKRTGYCVECTPRRVEAKLREEQILGWWAEGLTYQQMADRLGWTKNHMRVKVAQMRNAGYDLPRRPQGRFRHHREAA